MLYKNGCTGAEVGIIQNNLNMLSYDPKVIDCIFGENTEIAVKEFQGANGLVSDGIVGDCTWNLLLNKIRNVQKALNEHGFDLIVDGIAALNTYNCLLRFQEANNLIVDGIVGSQTMESLFKNDSCSSNSTSSNFDISDNGIGFIADYEDFYATPYRGLDFQNQTIGYGHVILPGENFESLTVEEAKALLQKDLQRFVHVVNIMIIGLSLKECQFDALVSFSYNCGGAALKDSSLLRDIKAGASDETIKDDFLMWSNCNHERALGIYRRRYDEYEMYSNSDYTRTYREFQ